MRWADALRRSGHRVTAPSRAVLSALFAADAPTTAEQIADGLGRRLPTLDFTLVDRNLERVEQLGFVGHVHWLVAVRADSSRPAVHLAAGGDLRSCPGSGLRASNSLVGHRRGGQTAGHVPHLSAGDSLPVEQQHRPGRNTDGADVSHAGSSIARRRGR